MEKFLKITCIYLTLILALFFYKTTVHAETKLITTPDGQTIYISIPDKLEKPSVEKIGEDYIKLTWQGQYYYDEHYEVCFYDSQSKKYTHIANTANTYYKVKNLKPGRIYEFKIRGYVTVNGQKYYGSFSPKLKASTRPKETSLTKASYTSTGKISLKWKKKSNIDGYFIQYSTSSKFKNDGHTCTVTSSSNSKIIGGLAKKTYYVRVCSYKKVSGIKYCSKWSKSKQVTVKKGLTVKQMFNHTKTDLSGRDTIKQLTKNGVDIKKYSTTYDRVLAIYKWHAKHSSEFAHCLACNASFNDCVYALYGTKKQYDTFIWIAGDNFKNRSGSIVQHKWSVIYLAGVPYIFDPRMQGNTKTYTKTTYFAIPNNSSQSKQYLFDGWIYYWGNETNTALF